MFSISKGLKEVGDLFYKLSLPEDLYYGENAAYGGAFKNIIKDKKYSIDSSKDVSDEFVFIRFLPNNAETKEYRGRIN